VSEQPDHRVAIVGAGFSGLGAAIRLRQRGEDDFVVFERADEVGGTWQANTYPGCQCDVASNLYSFSFAPNPGWSRTYSHQREIKDYLADCVERFGLERRMRLGTEVLRADWDEATHLWRLETSDGTATARVLIGGIGPLSEPAVPEVPGIESFEGKVFHSARWDHDHDLRGERVAAVGTGASAIQFVPRIQPDVGRLHLFQRSAPWILPHPDRPITRLERRIYRALPALHKLNRLGIYLSREWLALGMTRFPRLMKPLERIGRIHLRRQVRDPELRRKLQPSFTIGCKRILMSDDYYPALTQANVEVLDQAIAEVRPRSVLAADGSEREVDTIILGTGFRVTEFSGARAIRGVGGRSLAESWDGSPRAYLGTSIAGYPNFFMLLGPNTGLGHNSIVFMIESQIEHVLRCLEAMERRGATRIEIRPQAQAEFNRRLQDRMPKTVWMAGGCKSWYVDRTGVNSTLWPGFTWRFRQIARDVRPQSYRFDPVAAGRPVFRQEALAA
jgi:cation diffusion facilitator CzcD-associated flavoprotein CzcO